MAFNIAHHGDVTIIDVESQPRSGDLDTLVKRITNFCQGGHRKFILNLRGLERLSSTDIAGLVNINDTCKEHGAQLVLCQLQPKITYVLEITNIRSFFEVADSFSSAVALLGGGHDVIGDEAR
jgi:anti-anti-sigma factor